MSDATLTREEFENRLRAAAFCHECDAPAMESHLTPVLAHDAALRARIDELHDQRHAEARKADDARAALAAKEQECERLRELIEEVASCGVSMQDERLSYVEVQIDTDTWAEIKSVRAKEANRG